MPAPSTGVAGRHEAVLVGEDDRLGAVAAFATVQVDAAIYAFSIATE